MQSAFEISLFLSLIHFFLEFNLMFKSTRERLEYRKLNLIKHKIKRKRKHICKLNVKKE